MKSISTYITESNLGPLDIDAVKNFVMKMYKASTWKEAVDKQKFGDCEKLCRKIFKQFPDMFEYLYDLDLNYSKLAVKKLNDKGDHAEMWGNLTVLLCTIVFLFNDISPANTTIFAKAKKEDEKVVVEQKQETKKEDETPICSKDNWSERVSSFLNENFKAKE